MLRREGVARAGFQVALEGFSFGVVLEPGHDDGLPRTMLRRVGRLAGVVLLEALLEVAADAGVSLLRVREAFEEVDVRHADIPRRWSVLLRSFGAT